MIFGHHHVVRRAVDLVRGGCGRLTPDKEIPEGPYLHDYAITPNTCCETRSPRLAAGAVGAGLAQAEALCPGEHRPAIVGARGALARVKPARVLPQRSLQVAALGRSAWHVPHQVHDGRHLAESPSVSRNRNTAGPSRGRRIFKGLQPTYKAVWHRNYGCFKGAWQ